jgi:hypothetical protein
MKEYEKYKEQLDSIRESENKIEDPSFGNDESLMKKSKFTKEQMKLFSMGKGKIS